MHTYTSSPVDCLLMDTKEWKPCFAVIPLTGARICIVDSIACSGLSVIHSLLSSQVKQEDSTTVLLSFERPASEFIRTGRRMGHDLNLLLIQKRFWSINLACKEPSLGFKSLSLEESDLEDGIMGILKDIVGVSGQKLNIIADGIMALSTVAGWPLSKIMRFIKQLESSMPKQIVIRINRDCTDAAILVQWLMHRCETSLICNSLVSGITKQVHGELQIIKSPRDLTSCLMKCTDSSLLLQYKVS